MSRFRFPLLPALAVLLAAAFPLPSAFAGDDDEPHTGDLSADAAFMAAKGWYFICIQFLNLTGFPVQIDSVSGSDPSRTYHGAGHVIPVPSENDKASSVCYIGWRRNDDFMEGPDMTVKFHLVGYAGSTPFSPCTLRIVNHYAAWDGNEIHPASFFPPSQCKPLDPPSSSPGGTPVPLYHNVDFQRSGHFLSIAATLAFKDLGAANRQMPADLRQKTRKTAAGAISRAQSLPAEGLFGGKVDESEFLK